MCAAHTIQLKVPLLFIYYDVPSHPYQDKIIAFCVAIIGVVFLSAARERAVVPVALAALFIIPLGLSVINTVPDLGLVIGDKSRAAYWIQTALLALMWVVAFLLHYADPERTQKVKR